MSVNDNRTSAFLGEWNSASLDVDDHPDNSTVYRWIKGETLPKSADLFLRLAALLDVDPFALIEVPVSDVVEAADEVLRIVQNSFVAQSWLQFVHGFFGRQISWPPEEMASTYFGRPWHIEEFSHDPDIRANYYAQIVLERAPETSAGSPHVFHFAFRHPSMPSSLSVRRTNPCGNLVWARTCLIPRRFASSFFPPCFCY